VFRLDLNCRETCDLLRADSRIVDVAGFERGFVLKAESD